MIRLIPLVPALTLLVAILLLVPDASAQTATEGQLIISEFRLRGPGGASDEFIEIYNASGAAHTVTAASGTGYGVAASNGTTRCTILNGTVIPSRGHYLCVNSSGYSLTNYPAGPGTTATGNSTYTTEIPDNAGIAIFNNNSGGASYSLANRLDAVGSTSEANTLYREGTGYRPLIVSTSDYSFHRDECGNGGAIAFLALCTINGPKDTNSNSSDFVFKNTGGESIGAGQRLGAAGPQNLTSPISPSRIEPTYRMRSLDPCAPPDSPPNVVRDTTPDPGNDATFGTIDFRFRFINQTGVSTTKLRIRIIDLTTFPAPTGIADLRPRSSTSVAVTIDGAPCGSGSSSLLVQGTTLEAPPTQSSGGGFNSSLAVGTITLATPLANGVAVNVRFVTGVQQDGAFKLGFNLEAIPGGGTYYYAAGATSPFTHTKLVETPFNFVGLDHRSDISIYRPDVGQWWVRNSANGATSAATFGAASDRTVPGDYTGDGRTDRALYRPSTGEWFVLRSEDSTYYSVPFGLSTDIPVPADFDGDRFTDIAVFRPSNGRWYIQRTSDGVVLEVPFGVATDRPVPADYDGDHKTDVAIYRPNGPIGGQWWILYSGGAMLTASFGAPTDKVVPGDYTGDGRADIAVWRPSTGAWYILRSEDLSFYGFPFGANNDLPVPGDYDGDGKFDPGIFRPTGAQWYIANSTGGTTILSFGVNTDQPVPNTFVR